MSEPSYPNHKSVGGYQVLTNNLCSLEILYLIEAPAVSTVALGTLSISYVLKKAICESRQAQELSKLGHSFQPNYERVAKHGEKCI